MTTTAAPAAGPLDGLRVFDLTRGGVGPWASMIMAAMGANVIKIESPAGDGLQTIKPRYQGLSAVYLHCNLGKKAAAIDLKSTDGRELGLRLVREADVYLDNMRWGAAERLGLGYAQVAGANPGIVYVQCPGWGDSGPYKDRGSTDLSVQAFSGAASITGTRNGPPELLRWYALHDFNASSYIVVATLLGLLDRERSGRPQQILSPHVGASLAIQTSRLAEYLASSEDPARLGSGCATVVPERAFRCADGRWLAVAAVTHRQWRGLCEAIGAPELASDARFASNPDRVANRAVLEDRLEQIFAGQAARWWVIQLRKHRVPVSLFHDYETIPDLEQVRANRCLVSIRYPRLGRLQFGALPFQYSGTPVAMAPGPWPGQDTERVRREGWGPARAPRDGTYHGPTGPSERGVLDGVTVVDLSQGLSGPYASLLLADAGARVIKVEPPGGDHARELGPPMVGDVSAVFYHLNRNKEGLRLDPRRAHDRAQLRALIAQADVLIDDGSWRSLRRLGLDDRSLSELNPRLVRCFITPFGEKGPLRDQPASELILQAMSGFLNYLGTPGEEPVRMGPDMGSLGAGVFAAVGILGALYHAWRTGEGQAVAVNQLGTLLHQHGITFTSIVDPDEWSGFYVDANLKPPNTGLRAQDQRIVLNTMTSREDLRAVLDALGATSYLDDPLFQSSPRELTNQGISGNVAMAARPFWEAAFRRWRAEELVDLLNAHDSASALLNGYGQVLDHPQAQSLGMVQGADDPKHGRQRFMTPPWRMSGVDRVAPRPYLDPLGRPPQTGAPERPGRAPSAGAHT